MNFEKFDAYNDSIFDATVLFNEQFADDEDGEKLKAELKERQVAVVNGVPVVVWDHCIAATLNLLPEYEFGVAYFADLNAIIFNTATWNCPHRAAILAHESGHAALGHTTVTDAQEIEADEYSVNAGHDMVAALKYMRSEVLRFTENTSVQASVAGLDMRIAVLS